MGIGLEWKGGNGKWRERNGGDVKEWETELNGIITTRIFLKQCIYNYLQTVWKNTVTLSSLYTQHISPVIPSMGHSLLLSKFFWKPTSVYKHIVNLSKLLFLVVNNFEFHKSRVSKPCFSNLNLCVVTCTDGVWLLRPLTPLRLEVLNISLYGVETIG